MGYFVFSCYSFDYCSVDWSLEQYFFDYVHTKIIPKTIILQINREKKYENSHLQVILQNILQAILRSLFISENVGTVKMSVVKWHEKL